jgi:hypothetical protein
MNFVWSTVRCRLEETEHSESSTELYSVLQEGLPWKMIQVGFPPVWRGEKKGWGGTPDAGADAQAQSSALSCRGKEVQPRCGCARA